MSPITTVAAICAAVTLAAPSTTLPAEIKTKTQAMAAAFAKKDASWMEKNATSGFMAIDKDKKFNRAQTVAQLKELFAVTTGPATITAKILRFKKVGDTYVVTTDTSFSGSVKGPDGKSGKLVDQSTDDMTWVHAGGAWKLSIDKTISEHATFNGKPLGQTM